MSSSFKYSVNAFQKLTGFLCVYKPKGLTPEQFRDEVGSRIVALLNNLPHSPAHHFISVSRAERDQQLLTSSTEHILEDQPNRNELPTLFRPRKPERKEESEVESDLPDKLRIGDDYLVEVKRDFSDSKLVLGNRYEKYDLRLVNVHGLSDFSSGVSVFAIGRHSHSYADTLLRLEVPRTYHVRGRLGRATYDFTCDSHTTIRTSWRHVSHAKMDRVVTAFQRQSERALHALIGIDPHSQRTYELLASGRQLRPPFINARANDYGRTRPSYQVGTSHAHALFYRLRCVEFAPPDFGLEMQTAGEACTSILAFVDTLGARLGSSAHCTQLRRSKFGTCTTENCLLLSDIDCIDRLVENVTHCTSLLNVHSNRNLSALPA